MLSTQVQFFSDGRSHIYDVLDCDNPVAKQFYSFIKEIPQGVEFVGRASHVFVDVISLAEEPQYDFVDRPYGIAVGYNNQHQSRASVMEFYIHTDRNNYRIVNKILLSRADAAFLSSHLFAAEGRIVIPYEKLKDLEILDAL